VTGSDGGDLGPDITNDGLDTDTDGLCNDGDPDDDNDTCLDFVDRYPLVYSDDTDGDTTPEDCDVCPGRAYWINDDCNICFDRSLELSSNELTDIVFVNTAEEQINVTYHQGTTPLGPDDLAVNTVYLSDEDNSANSEGDIWYNIDFDLASFSLNTTDAVLTGATRNSHYHHLLRQLILHQ
jgi:hypothetical protein